MTERVIIVGSAQLVPDEPGGIVLPPGVTDTREATTAKGVCPVPSCHSAMREMLNGDEVCMTCGHERKNK